MCPIQGLPIGNSSMDSTHTVLMSRAYLVSVTIAEALATFVKPQLGLVLFGGILVLLFMHAASHWEHPSHGLFLSLAFIPIIRLLDLCLPLDGLPLVYRYLIISVPLLITAVLVVRALQFSWRDIGLNLRQLPFQILVGCTGLSFGYLQYQILKWDPLVKAANWEGSLFPALILFISPGFVEELIFRGVMQKAATESLGRVGGPVYVSALYAVLQIGHNFGLNVISAFGISLFYAWVVSRTRSIFGVTISHGLASTMLLVVLPLIFMTGGG